VRARSDELRAVTGWGPTARVAAVGHAWRSLALRMEQGNGATVSELGGDPLVELAPRLGVVVLPPGG
jgi:hypothetical protein